ncbi:hypothetical protein [Cellulophaga sp. BC115SP]|uniref:hypothetical protein n=1 Tax=Cellulophaga sp. BC115SP TaxID=2683263 RepID=UPI001411C4D8|nr:hypothetical protein [Cellulophaga sp. BC115SP]NBB28804.1 hypothetical protein [Cellulophaga sp. BC115SP]
MTNPIKIDDKAIIIRISQKYNSNMSAESLYEATRGVWRLSKERASYADIAFSVADGVILEVYEINSWHEAGTTIYHTRNDVHDYQGRFEFEGKIANEFIRNKYLGESAKSYFKRGSSNPITYINC